MKAAHEAPEHRPWWRRSAEWALLATILFQLLRLFDIPQEFVNTLSVVFGALYAYFVGERWEASRVAAVKKNGGGQ